MYKIRKSLQISKDHSEPKKEVHIIHHYLDGQNSETESNQELYSSVISLSQKDINASRYSLNEKSESSLDQDNISEKSSIQKKRRFFSRPKLSSFSKTNKLWKSKADSIARESVVDDKNNNITVNEYHSVLGSLDQSSSYENIFQDDLFARYQVEKDLSNFSPSPSEHINEIVSVDSDPFYNATPSGYPDLFESDSEQEIETVNELTRHTIKPLEYVDYYEVNHHGCVVFDNVWSNLMWREALR